MHGGLDGIWKVMSGTTLGVGAIDAAWLAQCQAYHKALGKAHADKRTGSATKQVKWDGKTTKKVTRPERSLQGLAQYHAKGKKIGKKGGQASTGGGGPDGAVGWNDDDDGTVLDDDGDNGTASPAAPM
jgi:hypothetical protein